MSGQLHVYADATRFHIAAAPTAHHVAIRKLAWLHAHDRSPAFHEHGRKRRHHSPPFGDFLGSGRAGVQPFTLSQLKSLLLYPANMGRNEAFDFGIAHPPRSGNFDASIGRLDPYVHTPLIAATRYTDVLSSNFKHRLS